MPPASQSILVVTALFAALVGIGLTELLDDKSGLHKEIGVLPFEWLPFGVAMLLSLRFLTGSANHLWKEHSKNTLETNTEMRWLMSDLGFVVLFGFFIAMMCYADDSKTFWRWGAGFLFIAGWWDAADWGWGGRSDWWFWVPLDFTHCFVFLLGTMMPRAAWKPWWLVVATASLFILVIDFWCQLTVVRGDKVKPPSRPVAAMAGFLARLALTVVLLVSATLVGLLLGGSLSQLLQERVVRMGWSAYRLWLIPVQLGLLSASVFLLLTLGRLLQVLKEAFVYIGASELWSPLGAWARVLSGGIACLAFVIGLLFAPPPLAVVSPPPPIDKTSTSRSTAVVPVLFELATANWKKGTTMTAHHESELRNLLEDVKACDSGSNPAKVQLRVRGFADDNEFRNLKKGGQAKANLEAANRRGDSLAKFIANLNTTPNRRSTDSAGLAVDVTQWSSFEEMKNARAYWPRPIAESTQADDHLNRRVDVVVEITGDCTSWEKAR